MNVNLDDFARRWMARWPDTPPSGFQALSSNADHTLRLHSLPQSKEYAETGADYAQLLHRHRVVLAGLLAQAGLSQNTPLVVMTATWSASAQPVPREPWLDQMVPAEYFTSALRDPDPQSPSWLHTFVSSSELMDDALVSLFLLTAGEQAAGTIITTGSLDWLYRPYHGGMDIMGLTESQVSDLEEKHSVWLPADNPAIFRGRHPDGDVPGWTLEISDMNETTARRLLAVAEQENLLIAGGHVLNPRRDLTLHLDRHDAQLLKILLTGESQRVLSPYDGHMGLVGPEDARQELIGEGFSLAYELDDFVKEYGYRDPREALDGVLPGKYWDPKESYEGIIGRGPAR